MAERRSPGERFVNSKFSKDTRTGRTLRHLLVQETESVNPQDTTDTGTISSVDATVKKYLLFGQRETHSSMGPLPKKEE